MRFAHTFAALLRQHRLASGLSQEALADRAGLSRRGVSDLERGLKQAPRLDTVTRLADALHLDDMQRAAFIAAARPPRRPFPMERPLARMPRAYSRPRLVGRERELALLEHHLAGEGPPVLLFAGEPGIGKSRLLEEAVRARADGWRVLQAGCRRRSRQEPYAPLPEALARYVATRTPAQVRADLQGAAWVVRLLPELAEDTTLPQPRWHLKPDQERRMLFAAVRRYLANIAGPRGTLLVLDDMQWAGGDVLALLADLAHHALDARDDSSPRLRMIAAYRTTDVRAVDALASVLVDLDRDALVQHAELAPLAPETAAELVELVLDSNGVQMRDSLPAAVREELLRRADGVPFFLLSGARALLVGEELGESETTLTAETGEAGQREGSGGVSGDQERVWHVPWSVAQSIQVRMAALDETTRKVLGVAAVAGRVSAPALLFAVAELEEDEVLRSLDAACAAGLLVEIGADYQFAHDLVREAVEEGLSAIRRRALHRRIAIELERAGEAADERLAYHFTRAGEAKLALPHRLRAGGQVEKVYAYAAAEVHYRAAVELSRAAGDPAHQAEALYKLANVLAQQARYAEALEHLEQATTQYHALGDAEGKLHTVAAILSVHGSRGTFAEGLARAEPIVAHLHQHDPRPSSEDATRESVQDRLLTPPSPGRAALYMRLAHLYFYGGRYREELEAAKEAVRQARATGDADLIRHALHAFSLAQWNNEADLTVSMPRFEEVIALAERAGDGQLLSQETEYLATMHLFDGQLTRAREENARALEMAERFSADPTRIAGAYVETGKVDFWQGEWERACDLFERAHALMEQADPTLTSWRAAYPPICLGEVDIAQGREAQGMARLAQGLAIAEPHEDLQALRHAHSVLAECELLAGKAPAAYDRLDPLLDRPGLQEPDVAWRMLHLMAWAELALGKIEEAERRVVSCLARSTPERGQFLRPDARRVEALLAIARGDWARASAALDDAIQLAGTMLCPYPQAKALYVYGILHRAQGQPDRARERLEQALAICRRLGERLYTSQIERVLAELDADG